MNDSKDYNQIFALKTKQLAVEVINLLSEIPYSDKISVIRKQIFRSVTSVAANYRAMCRARSRKEKYSKLCIVVEEADETLFWLELIEELKILEHTKIIEVKIKAEEILKVTSSYRKKLGNNL